MVEYNTEDWGHNGERDIKNRKVIGYFVALLMRCSKLIKESTERRG